MVKIKHYFNFSKRDTSKQNTLFRNTTALKRTTENETNTTSGYNVPRSETKITTRTVKASAFMDFVCIVLKTTRAAR